MRFLKYFTESNELTTEPPWSFLQMAAVKQSLRDILNRPWFTRMWTVREATLARRTLLICGEHTVSWACNLKTMRSNVFRIKSAAISPYFSLHLSPTNDLDWSPLLSILETQMRQAARRKGVTLRRNQLDLAYDFRHRMCYDPRDKYFAIFSIIENDRGGRLTFRPDYSTSLEQVHKAFTSEIRRLLDNV